MPAEKAEKPEILFDVRVIERNVRAGAITKKELQQFLAELEDVADKVAEPEPEGRGEGEGEGEKPKEA